MDLGAIIFCCLTIFALIFIFILSKISVNRINKYKNTLENGINHCNINLNYESTNNNNDIIKDKSISEIMYEVKYNFTPRQFEIFCYYLFLELGYKVELTKYEHDGGKDLILNNHIVVECKKFITQKVGREICQKLLGSMLQNKADKAIIINTGSYNSNALEIERDVDALKLLNFFDIKSMLIKIGKDAANKILVNTKKYYLK